MFSMEQCPGPVPALQRVVVWGQQHCAGSGDLRFLAAPLIWAQTSLQAQIVVGCSLHQLFTAGYLLSGLCLNLPQMWLKLPKHASSLQIRCKDFS